MARLLVYDAYENKVYTYSSLNENDPMPYSTGTTLTVREFRGRSNSPVLWTTIAAMEAWNLTRRKYGRGIPVGYAFRRIWEGGHGTRSSTTQACPSMWGSASARPSALPSTEPPAPPGRGATSSR